MSLKKPYISVIIPTYNRAECVGEAIESVLHQTYRDFELIVVDDGSTDNTQEILDHFSDQIRVVHQLNAGVSAARNAGILAAQSEWVAFLDSDDEWYPDALTKLFTPFPNDSKIVARVGNIDFADGALKSDLFHLRLLNLMEPAVLTRPLLRILSTWFFPSGFAARRDSLIQAGLFDSRMRYNEDADLFCRLGLLGPWLVTPQIVARVCRKTIGDCLSLSSVGDPEYHPRAMVLMFRSLLLAESMTCEEISYVLRQLSGAWHDRAQARYIKKGKSWRYFLWKAIVEGRTATAFIRSAPALVLGGIGFRWAEKLRSLKRSRKPSFRRSEIHASSEK